MLAFLDPVGIGVVKVDLHICLVMVVRDTHICVKRELKQLTRITYKPARHKQAVLLTLVGKGAQHNSASSQHRKLFDPVVLHSGNTCDGGHA